MPNLGCFARLALLKRISLTFWLIPLVIFFVLNQKPKLAMYIVLLNINYIVNFSNIKDFELLRKRQLGFSNGFKLSSRAHDLLSSVK